MDIKIYFCGLIILSLVSILFIFKDYPLQTVTKMIFHQRNQGTRVGKFKGLAELEDEQQNRHHIHLVSLRYSGQQGAGVRALTALQCWASHSGLPISIVEPIISKTKLMGTLNNKSTAMGLTDYFDVENFNTASRKAGFGELTTRKEFFKRGSRSIVYVHTGGEANRIAWTNATDSCLNLPSHSSLRKMIGPQYCIVQIASTHGKTLTKQRIYQILQHWSERNITLVFSKWLGLWFTTPQCENIGKHSIKNQFHPSKRLLRDAQHYEDLYMSSNKSLAIMIRLERVLVLTRIKPGHTVHRCFQDLVQVSKKLKSKSRSDNMPMVAADIGRYGSDTWKWFGRDHNGTAKKEAIDVIQVLLNHQMSLERWERSFVEAAGGVTNRGYIAALQRVIASRADCLVLMGGGSFQDLALQDYMYFHENRDEWCIHIICATDEEILERRIQTGLK